MPLMGWVAANLLIGGQQPVLMGNDNFTAAPSGTFVTQDGYINIAANKQEQWEAVCDVLGRAGAEDRPAVPEARRAQGEPQAADAAARGEARRSSPTAHWVEVLNAKGVPSGEILGLEAALAQPQIAAPRHASQTVHGAGHRRSQAVQPDREVREDARRDRRAAAAPLGAHRRDPRRPRLLGRSDRRVPPEGSRLTHGHDRRTEDPGAGLGPAVGRRSATWSSRRSTWRCRTRTPRWSSTSSSRSTRAPASSRRSGTRRRSPSSSTTACRPESAKTATNQKKVREFVGAAGHREVPRHPRRRGRHLPPDPARERLRAARRRGGRHRQPHDQPRRARRVRLRHRRHRDGGGLGAGPRR